MPSVSIAYSLTAGERCLGGNVLSKLFEKRQLTKGQVYGVLKIIPLQHNSLKVVGCLAACSLSLNEIFCAFVKSIISLS